MREVVDKNEYIIDLRPYFIDLRKDLVVAKIPVRQEAVMAKAVPREKFENIKKSFFRGAVEYAAYAVVFVMLVWGTPMALTKALDSDQPIASITSSSMWPVLKRGDIVFIKGVNEKADINLKDIVVFENQRGYTIHRVIKLRDETLVTRGDANNIDDAPVGYDKVVGKAVTWSNGNVVNIPLIGKFSQTVQNMKGKILKTVLASISTEL